MPIKVNAKTKRKTVAPTSTGQKSPLPNNATYHYVPNKPTGPKVSPPPGSSPVPPRSSAVVPPSGSPKTTNVVVENEPPDTSGGSTLVPGLIFGLIIINAIASGQIKNIFGLITNQSGGVNVSSLHTQTLILFGEFVFAIALSIIAETNRSARQVIIVFVIALYLVWGFSNRTILTNWIQKLTGTTQNKSAENKNTSTLGGVVAITSNA